VETIIGIGWSILLLGGLVDLINDLNFEGGLFCVCFEV
jgi:hypothetical protein